MADYTQKNEFRSPVIEHIKLMMIIADVIDDPDVDTPLIPDVAAAHVRDKPAI